MTSPHPSRPVAGRRRWWLRLLAYARPERGSLAAVAALSVVTVAVQALQPWPLKLVVDHVLRDRRLPEAARWVESLPGAGAATGLLAWLAGATVLLLVLGGAALTVQRAISTTAGARMTYALGQDLFHHVQRLSIGFHQRRTAGDLVQRVTKDTSCAQTLTLGVLLPLVEATLTLLVMLTVMWRIDPVLSILSLLVALPLALAIRLFFRRMADRSYVQYELEGEMMALAEQALTALPVVQAFGREEHEERRFRSLSDSTVTAYVRASLAELQFSITTGGVIALGTALMMALGGARVVDGRLSIGSLLVFLAYLASLYAPLQTLAALSAGVANAAASSRRVFEVLDAEEDVADRPGAIRIGGRLHGHVRFEDVTFGYEPGRPVLQNVTLDTRPGETVALVGRTGAGKSTIVSLIPRFFDPWHGRVTLDGVDVRGFTLASLRAQVSLVLQEPFLLPISVADNIAYGRPDATRDQIAAAARDANAEEFITHLPDGYDTVIGERGATLSGGQRQRIAIARALLKDAPVLILDEPTSALDTETEALILEALQRLMAGRTTFIIAHRLSTIRQADRIAVLEHGHLAELGTHHELLHNGGPYHRFHRLHEVPGVRIALVSQEYPPETAHGGIATQAHRKAHGLAALGHEVHVISRSHDGVERRYRQGQVEVRRLPLPHGFTPWTEAADWLSYSGQVAGAVQELHEAHPLDVVEFAEYGAEGYVHLLNRTDGNRIPTVIQLHGPLVMLAAELHWPDRDSELFRIGTHMEQTCLRLANAVYSSSDCSSAWCASAYQLCLHEVPTLHTGVDTRHFRPGRVPRDPRPTIAFVGKIAESKGVGILVDACLALAREVPGLRLQLVGKGDAALLDALGARCAAAGHPDLVEVVGFVPHDDLPDALGRAHVFAAPFLYEGGPGLVYLEAMACGLPVVACGGSGVEEVVRHGEQGLLVPPGDVGALTRALRELLDDPRRADEMGVAGRSHVVETADTERCISRIERLYLDVVERVGA